MKYDKVHKVLGEGNFVLVISEGQFGGKHVASTTCSASRTARSPSTGTRSRPFPEKKDWKNQTASSSLRPRSQSAAGSAQFSAARTLQLSYHTRFTSPTRTRTNG